MKSTLPFYSPTNYSNPIKFYLTYFITLPNYLITITNTSITLPNYLIITTNTSITITNTSININTTNTKNNNLPITQPLILHSFIPSLIHSNHQTPNPQTPSIYIIDPNRFTDHDQPQLFNKCKIPYPYPL